MTLDTVSTVTVREVKCANTYFTHFHQLVPFLCYTKIIQNVPYFGVSGGCLEGVLEVSGDYLSDPGYCLEGYVVGSIEKKIILGHFNQLRHFLTVANFRRFRAQNAKFQV